MMRSAFLFLVLGCLLSGAAPSYSEPVSPRKEPLQFLPLSTEAGEKPIAAVLYGNEGYSVSWRLGEEGARLVSVSDSGVIRYRASNGELKAILLSGGMADPEADWSGSQGGSTDSREEHPAEGLNAGKTTVSGTGSNGLTWTYPLPGGRMARPDMVGKDLLGNLYFHDDRLNWYALDQDGRELYRLQWEVLPGRGECLAAPSGDAVCAYENIGLFAIRQETGYIRFYIDGREQFYAPRPILEEGAVYAPFRSLFASMGAQVEWDSGRQAAVASRGGRTVKIAIGSREAWIDGRKVELEHPPQLLGDYTFVPLRFVSEALGAQVIWEAATRSVQVVLP